MREILSIMHIFDTQPLPKDPIFKAYEF